LVAGHEDPPKCGHRGERRLVAQTAVSESAEAGKPPRASPVVAGNDCDVEVQAASALSQCVVQVQRGRTPRVVHTQCNSERHLVPQGQILEQRCRSPRVRPVRRPQDRSQPLLPVTHQPRRDDFRGGRIQARSQHGGCDRQLDGRSETSEHRFNDVFASGRAIEAGCNAHGRRKFRDAEATQPVLAAEGGPFLGAIYGEEEKAQNLALRGDALREHRQQCIRPIIRNFQRWLDAVKRHPPRSLRPPARRPELWASKKTHG